MCVSVGGEREGYIVAAERKKKGERNIVILIVTRAHARTHAATPLPEIRDVFLVSFFLTASSSRPMLHSSSSSSSSTCHPSSASLPIVRLFIDTLGLRVNNRAAAGGRTAQRRTRARRSRRRRGEKNPTRFPPSTPL